MAGEAAPQADQGAQAGGGLYLTRLASPRCGGTGSWISGSLDCLRPGPRAEALGWDCWDCRAFDSGPPSCPELASSSRPGVTGWPEIGPNGHRSAAQPQPRLQFAAALVHLAPLPLGLFAFALGLLQGPADFRMAQHNPPSSHVRYDRRTLFVAPCAANRSGSPTGTWLNRDPCRVARV